MDELREKTIIGSFWSLFERFGYLTIQFLSNLIFAWLLLPEDFGIIGILLIFTSLSTVLVDSGLLSALVQKKTISDTDTSTMFYTNLGISIIVYVLVFLFAPLIASLFKNQDIIVLLRIIELTVIVEAFSAVQTAILSRNMKFNILAKYKIIAIIIAVVVSVSFAFLGFGVWSLVIQYIVYSFVRVCLLWLHSDWRPKLIYSKNSFSSLFGYGSKLLLAQFISELYVNFQSIIIGSKFMAKDLGFFTQAKQLQQVPVQSLSNVVNSVSFPAFSRLQDDKKNLLTMVRQNLKGLVFINTPLMFYLSVAATPLLVFLYSSKWVQSVPYFQFLCLGFGVLLIIHQCTLTTLRALGRSDYVLKLEITKKIIGITLLVSCTFLWGIWGVMIGLTINSVIELFLNGYYLKREIGYGAAGQFIDLLPALLLSLVSSVVTSCLLIFVIPGVANILKLTLSFLCFTGTYISLAYFFKVDSLWMFKKIFDRFVLPRLSKK